MYKENSTASGFNIGH